MLENIIICSLTISLPHLHSLMIYVFGTVHVNRCGWPTEFKNKTKKHIKDKITKEVINNQFIIIKFSVILISLQLCIQQ